MVAQNHDMLWLGAAGAAAFAGYEFLYKPWKAAHAATVPGSILTGPGAPAAPAAPSAGYSYPYVTSPTVLTPQPVQPSNLNPGAAVGGLVGTCMSRKGWTQSQCQQRLDALVAAYNANKARIVSLQPGAPGLVAAQTQLAATQNALQNAMAQFNAATAAGNPAAALQWKTAMDGHNADIAALSAAINSAPTQITASQSAMAANASDYQALTGVPLT